MIFHQVGNSKGNFHVDSKFYTNRDYAPHFHKNMEVIVVLEGTMEVTTNGLHETLVAGEAALILSNQIHAFRVYQNSTAWVSVFSEDYVPAFCDAVSGKQGRCCRFIPDKSIMELLKTQMLYGECSQIMKKACFYALCDQYYCQVEMEPRQEKTNFMVGQILDWIATHYTEDVSLKEVAKAFGYEYHYLSRLLNKNYAISFTSLLNGYRVEHAMKLLRNSELGVTDIAEASGFQSIRSFNLCFIKAVGMTPKAYRHTR